MTQIRSSHSAFTISAETPQLIRAPSSIYLTINSDTSLISGAKSVELSIVKCQGQLSQSKSELNNSQKESIDVDRLPNDSKNKTIRKRRVNFNQRNLQKLEEMFDLYNLEKSNGFEPTTTLQDIADKFKASYANILLKYKQFRANNHIPRASPPSKRPYKYNQAIMQQLKHLQQLKSFSTQKELVRQFNERYQANLTRKVVKKYLQKIEPVQFSCGVEEYNPTEKCVTVMMRDLLHSGRHLLFYSYRMVQCQKLESVAISVLCSQYGFYFTLCDVQDRGHISSNFKPMLTQYRQEIGLGEMWVFIGQLFEKSTSGLERDQNRNKDIQKELLEQKGKAFYLTQAYGHYNLAERHIRHIVSESRSPRTKQNLLKSLLKARDGFFLTTGDILASISTQVHASLG